MSVFSYQIPYDKRGKLSDAGRTRKSMPGGSTAGSIKPAAKAKSPENRVHNLSADDAKDDGRSNRSGASQNKSKSGSQKGSKKRQK